MRQECLGAVDHSPEVDVDDLLDVLEGGGVDVAVVRDARVVVDLVEQVQSPRCMVKKLRMIGFR